MYIYIRAQKIAKAQIAVGPSAPFWGTTSSCSRIPFGSPSWHRKRRALRARCRTRIRKARRAGVPPARRDLLLLSGHHSRPRYRETLPMSQTWGGKGGRNWNYWHGAWSPRAQQQQDQQQQPPWHRKPKPEGKNAQGQALFPAYDAKRPPKNNAQPASDLLTVVSTSSSKDHTLIKDMQKVLNTARKAEQKVSRLREDKAAKIQMWEEWEHQLKQQYLTESRRHQANLDALDRDLEAALVAQDLARDEVRKAAEPRASQDVQMSTSASELDTAFAKLIGDGQQDPWMDNEAVLQRALEASLKGLPSTPPPSTPLPRTPYGRVLPAGVRPQGAQVEGSSRLQPFPPPKNAEARYPAADLNPVPSPVACADPYQSPQPLRPQDSMQGVVSSTMSGVPSHASGAVVAPGPHQSPGQGRQLKVRQDVKEASRPAGPIRVAQTSPNVAREEMKEAKRAELWARSLQGGQSVPQAVPGNAPTIGSVSMDNVQAGETGEPPGAPQVQRFSLNYDDGEDAELGVESDAQVGLMD